MTTRNEAFGTKHQERAPEMIGRYERFAIFETSLHRGTYH